jgi:hypothetical protein
MSINWWVEKQSMLYSYNGISFGYKNKWSNGTCYNRNELWQCYAKKPITEDDILYNPFMWNIQNNQIYAKLGVVMCAYNPSTQESEAGRLQAWDQPG